MDYLIYYETVQREYENACLIKAELKQRGYSCFICNTIRVDFWKSFFINPKVIIVHGLYNQGCIDGFITRFRKKREAKVLNLQYEQLLPRGSDGLLTQMPEGQCKNALHVCWGSEGEKNCIESGVDKNHIFMSGAIQLDFCKPRFSGYYRSKIDISNEFMLPSSQKWILFISDFVFFSDAFIRSSCGIKSEADYILCKDIERYKQRMFDVVVSYIEKFLKGNSEYIFIYRPHPSECNNDSIELLEKKYSCFKCIRDYSVKQWISVCDVVETWSSTSIVEAYAMGKACGVINLPIEEMTDNYKNYLPDIIDVNKAITNYDDFSKFILSDGHTSPFDNPLDLNIIREYYGDSFNKNQYVYTKICDKLIEMNSNDRYSHVYIDSAKSKSGLLHDYCVTLRGNIRYIIFPIINKVFPSKCKLDDLLLLHHPKKLKQIYMKIEAIVADNTMKN